MLEDAPHMKARLLNATLAEFDISETRGYLPETDPLYSLILIPLPVSILGWAQKAEEIAGMLPKILISDHVHEKIAELKQFWHLSFEDARDVVGHLSLATVQALMRIVSFLGNAWVWGGVIDLANERPQTSIPSYIAIMWYLLAERIGCRPSLCYFPYALYNWRRLNTNRPIELGNIALINNFFGGVDEEWFILIHVDINANMGTIPMRELNGLRFVARRDISAVEKTLEDIAYAQGAMYKTLTRMIEWCDQHTYMYRVRPHIQGWHTESKILPDGVIYKGVTPFQEKSQCLRGETGAMDSISPSLYAFLGVDHAQDKFRDSLYDMRNYMPGGHRAFIEFLEKADREGISLRSFVEKNGNVSMREKYRTCLLLLADFLELHRDYALSYIVGHASKSRQNPGETGTGGTHIERYLTGRAKHIREMAQSV